MMKQKRRYKLILIPSALLSITLVWLVGLLTGCGKETVTEVRTVTKVDTVTVTEVDTVIETESKIFLCWLQSEWSAAVLCSDPIADTAQSQVTIKWSTGSRVFPEEEIYSGYIWFRDTTELTPLTSYTIELTSNLGNCSGTVTLPESLSITSPEDGDTLPLGDPVNCTWTSAESANAYRVWVYVEAYDSTGNSLEWDVDIETFVTSTSYTIPASIFNCTDARYYVVGLEVYSYAGPIPQPGAQGNMTGDLKGFLSAEGYGDHVYFYVGTPTGKGTHEHPIKRPTVNERMNAYLERLGVDGFIK